MTARRFVPAAVTLAAATAALSFRTAESPVVRINAAAAGLLETLDEGQRTTLLLPADSETRPQWHFVPKDERKGLPLKAMSKPQRQQTARLLRAALSGVGAKKVSQIRTLEGIVRDLEGEGRRWSRDPAAYHLTFFGEPSAEGRWALSFEGHHVSLNLLFEGGEIAASTPQFLGAHPAVVSAETAGNPTDGPWKVLGDEAELAFTLAASLTEEQRSQAMTSETPPKEIRNSGEPQPTAYDAAAGVAGRDLSAAQRRILGELVATYCEVMNETTAARRMLEIGGLGDVRFSYSGTMAWGEPHAYVVQGPTFVIEYVNTQPDAEGNPANHAHCIYRDLRGDFGQPLAAE